MADSAVHEPPSKNDSLTRTAAPGRSRPIAHYLYALILVILLPALAVSMVLLKRNNDAQEDVVRALTNATVQAMGHSVDREIAGMATTLRVLSTAGSLTTNMMGEFHNRSTMALVGTGAYLVAVDQNLDPIINTRFQYGDALPPIVDRETAKRALDSGIATVSGLYASPTTKNYAFNVWLPLRDARPAELLALTQSAVNLVPALQSRQMPEGWHAALVDQGNQVLAATSNAGLNIGDTLPIRREGSVRSSEWVEEVVDGQRVVTAEWRSPVTGWRIVAWTSAAQVSRPFGDTLLQLAAWGITIAIGASIIAFLLAQRIRKSVQGLQGDARSLGRGKTVLAKHYPVAEIAEVSTALAESSLQLQVAERDVRFLMRELAHRSKNQMAVIAAMAKQTARGASDVPSYVQSLERRIMGLARSTDLLLAHGRAGVELSELVDQQLAPFSPGEAQLDVSGPAIRINPQGAQILGMALHELATNAMRFGAFSDPEGKVTLRWQPDNERLVVTWRETLSQPLAPRGQAGFGSTVLLSMVGGALGASVTHADHPDGIEWVLSIPLSALDPSFAAIRPDETIGQ